MEIFGIGPSELIFVVVLALIILGPKDMQKAGKTIGKFLRSIVTSDGWRMFQQTSRELRTLPNRLIREANEELNKIGKEIDPSAQMGNLRVPDYGNNRMKAPNTPPRSQPVSTEPAVRTEHVIAPQSKEDDSSENEGDQQKDA